MNYRLKLEIIFIASLVVVTLILSQMVTLYKTEYIGLDWNPWYVCFLLGICIAFLLFNITVLGIRVVPNLVYSGFAAILLLPSSIFCVQLWVAHLEKLDNGVTPLGWQFQYKWLELLVFGVLLMVGTEVIGKRLSQAKTRTE